MHLLLMWERYLSSMSEFLLFLTDSETTESAYGVAYCRFSLLAVCLVSLVFPMLKFYRLANLWGHHFFLLEGSLVKVVLLLKCTLKVRFNEGISIQITFDGFRCVDPMHGHDNSALHVSLFIH